MDSRYLRSIVLGSLAALVAMPAFADVQANLGSLHIRIADNAPPPARYERRMTPPDRDSIWITGYWHRQDNRWDWIDGRWDRPVDRNVRWIKPQYTREGCPWYRQQGCGWRYAPGHWSNQQLVEGEDYQQWKHEHQRGHGNGNGNGHNK
jgi:hypothetical protein